MSEESGNKNGDPRGSPFLLDLERDLFLGASFEDLEERAGLQFFEGQRGGGGDFFLGHGARIDRLEEEVQEALAGGGVVEDVSNEGRLSSFLHEVLQSLAGCAHSAEEERVDGGVTGG